MWWYIVLFIVALVVAYAMAPKPQNNQATLGTIEAPTASEGASIPVLFGSRVFKQQNVVWYGDIRTEAIKKKGGKK